MSQFHVVLCVLRLGSAVIVPQGDEDCLKSRGSLSILIVIVIVIVILIVSDSSEEIRSRITIRITIRIGNSLKAPNAR